MEMVKAVVEARFAHGPGHELVKQGDWKIFSSKDCRFELCRFGCFTPGMKVTMAIVLPRKDPQMRCPRPKCPSTNYFNALGGGKTW